MSRPRSEAVSRLHGPSSKAARAARTARLMSSASPSATLARVSPGAGVGVANVSPDAASVHCPLMNSLRGAAVNSSTVLSTVTVMTCLISVDFGSHNLTTVQRPDTSDLWAVVTDASHVADEASGALWAVRGASRPGRIPRSGLSCCHADRPRRRGRDADYHPGRPAPPGPGP